MIKRNCHLLFVLFLDYVNDYYFLNVRVATEACYLFFLWLKWCCRLQMVQWYWLLHPRWQHTLPSPVQEHQLCHLYWQGDYTKIFIAFLSINLNYISEQIFPVTKLLRVLPPVFFRALYAAQIVKEQVFVQSGWETLRSPTHQFPSSEELYQIHREGTASTGKGSRVWSPFWEPSFLINSIAGFSKTSYTIYL